MTATAILLAALGIGIFLHEWLTEPAEPEPLPDWAPVTQLKHVEEEQTAVNQWIATYLAHRTELAKTAAADAQNATPVVSFGIAKADLRGIRAEIIPPRNSK